MKGLVIVITGLLLAMPAGADVYKWVDSTGKVHYSDKPVDLTAGRVDVRSARTDYDRLERDRQAAIEAAQRQAEEATKQAEVDARQAEVDRVNAENCAKAQRNLNRVVSAQRLYEVDAEGERTYLSDAEIEARRQTARDDVARYCDE